MFARCGVFAGGTFSGMDGGVLPLAAGWLTLLTAQPGLKVFHRKRQYKRSLSHCFYIVISFIANTFYVQRKLTQGIPDMYSK